MTTPTRNEAVPLRVIRLPMMSREQYEQFKDDLHAALAAEREPLLAALRALVEAVERLRVGGSVHEAMAQARALIEQDGRTE